jgi:hypothetical protein
LAADINAESITKASVHELVIHAVGGIRNFHVGNDMSGGEVNRPPRRRCITTCCDHTSVSISVEDITRFHRTSEY